MTDEKNHVVEFTEEQRDTLYRLNVMLKNVEIKDREDYKAGRKKQEAYVQFMKMHSEREFVIFVIEVFALFVIA